MNADERERAKRNAIDRAAADFRRSTGNTLSQEDARARVSEAHRQGERKREDPSNR